MSGADGDGTNDRVERAVAEDLEARRHLWPARTRRAGRAERDTAATEKGTRALPPHELPAEEPARHADPTANRPPRWLPRALAMAALTVFVAIGVWNAMSSLSGLLVNLLIAFFVALALEPMVLGLVRHGWRRGAAAAVALLGTIVVVIVVMALFGNLFVQQLVELFGAIPEAYASVTAWIEGHFDVVVPGSDEVLDEIVSQWGQDVASGALLVGVTLVSGVFAALTIGLVTYYLLAAGPRFRAAICRYLTPNRQTEVLRLWEITQAKVSDFISSRVVLAAFCTVATGIFLLIARVPYALPLALFTGLVSQFVPTIGTYLGGALPAVVALTSNGLTTALVVVAFVIAYQQVENLYLSPKVSAQALEMNPAVSFVAVLAFGAVFGALGAFLALPVAATIQAVGNTYLRRHELVASPMLADPGHGGRADHGGEGTPAR